MNVPTLARRFATFVAAALILGLSGTMAWAAVNDFGARGKVPNGVSIMDTDLSGMTAPAAREAIRRTVATPLMRPVTLNAEGAAYVLDPRPAIRLDVEGMLAEAYEPRRTASFLTRLYSDITGAPVRKQVTPRFKVDSETLDSWIADVAKGVYKRTVDATLTVVDSHVRIEPSETGRRLDRETTRKALVEAFEASFEDADRDLEATVKVTDPKVTEDEFGKTIVVDISQRKIRLFDGAKLEKTYPCAVGTPGFPTPRGEFEIIQKRYMPTWVNPAPNGWGADMPRSIPPGPSNPLGTRALNLSAPGIRFHGTTNIGSIGTAASHGCMRMRRSDIEDFYERVEVGTKVYIIE